MMSGCFEDLMYIFGVGARGGGIFPKHKVDWKAVLELADEHGVWQTAFLAVNDEIVKKQYESRFVKSITFNMQRIAFSIDAIETMERSGIGCRLLKGISVARFYKEPLCRISGDTDVLILPQNEKKAMSVLKKIGYEVTPRGENSHHFLARHPVGGLMEVHVKMYSDPTKDILLNNMIEYNENNIEFNLDGHKLKTLGITDGAIYLTAHYIKHFISKGVGIRQLMDVLLYIEHYENDIDWDRYTALFTELRYEKLIKNIMAIGNKYFGFDFAETDDSCMEIILYDSAVGGVFGKDSNRAENFYEAFLRRRTTMSGKNLDKYMTKKTRAGLFRRLFPERTVMQSQGYVCNSAWQLVGCYIIRLCRLSKYMVTNRTKRKQMMSYSYDTHNESENIKKRLEMMKNLDIVD